MTYSPFVDKESRSIFGESTTVEPTASVQLTSQYNIDPSLRDDLEVFTATGGSVDAVNSMFRCQTGTSVGGYGVVRSKDTVIYRAGEGVVSMFTAAFTTGIATSLQFAGLFSLTETLAFGYDGANFSIIHEYNGIAEVQTVQVTSAATGSETATVTVDGDAVSCSLTNTTVQGNAYEIARDCLDDATVSGKWRIEQINDSVLFIAKSVGNKTGTMSFSSATATATVTETTTGGAKSTGNIAQGSWDVAPFSGFNPTKLNLYRIAYRYLGAAGPHFNIYNPNTSEFQRVHTIKWANLNTTPFLSNPDFKIGYTAASLGSSGTNLTVTGASVYAGVLGKYRFRNQTFAVDNTVTGVDTTLKPILSIKNRIVFGDRFNLSEVQPVEVSVENDHTKGLIVEVYKDSDLTGATNYQLVDEYNSIMIWDSAATGISNGRLLISFIVEKGGSQIIDLSRLGIEVAPEEILTIAAKTVSTSGAIVTAALTWIEEK